ncbi:MAG: ribose 5-phosphate isomerase A [Planctomycetota bacterium]|nr:ribose 5-phosphate isomerase A [Planctomycetota bacterium]MDA1139515.1 ribose 5-phosphate isomerase A [Planctomycetota bacterium]
MTQDELKKLSADKAVEFVEDGMVLGLGTGSTAKFVVDRLGELVKSGDLKKIIGVPTSQRTREQAEALGIQLSTLDDHPRLDLAIDGADEVDPCLNLVKGRGGALLREKMVEQAAEKFVVTVDETKMVAGLGVTGALPVDVVQYCWKYTASRLGELGCRVELRGGEGKPFVTDNGNYILDLFFVQPIDDPYAASKFIQGIASVAEHGLFLDMATTIVVARQNGVEVIHR